ncbi:hypothetical protein GWI33_015822 [Rhynchophorus ferrugineus]|uniref:Uncharacterized protein n=1 Tax=Rhynchophorus ferrugineus TaxID=354439 RepID=A0A834M420_RHYFE|nr:hypothetical protein GWI33_015822 [Rhynchophorus ferrugineus]
MTRESRQVHRLLTVKHEDFFKLRVAKPRDRSLRGGQNRRPQRLSSSVANPTTAPRRPLPPTPPPTPSRSGGGWVRGSLLARLMYINGQTVRGKSYCQRSDIEGVRAAILPATGTPPVPAPRSLSLFVSLAPRLRLPSCLSRYGVTGGVLTYPAPHSPPFPLRPHPHEASESEPNGSNLDPAPDKSKEIGAYTGGTGKEARGRKARGPQGGEMVIKISLRVPAGRGKGARYVTVIEFGVWADGALEGQDLTPASKSHRPDSDFQNAKTPFVATPDHPLLLRYRTSPPQLGLKLDGLRPDQSAPEFGTFINIQEGVALVQHGRSRVYPGRTESSTAARSWIDQRQRLLPTIINAFEVEFSKIFFRTEGIR